MTGHLNLLILVVTFSLSPLGAMVIVGTLLLVVKVIVTVTMECITINRKIELFNLLQVQMQQCENYAAEHNCQNPT